MRYLVTGATGFVGSKLTKKLIDKGDEVVAFVRDQKKARQIRDQGAKIAVGDITDKESILRAMDGIDGVFHLAAIYKIGGVKREHIEEVNVQGSRNVFEAINEKDIKRSVYTSSLAVFSDTKGNIYDESYIFKGNHLSLYDETKWRAHYEVAKPMIDNGLNLIIVMPGLIYGPGDTSQMGDLFSDFLKGKDIMLPKESAFCFTYVDDAVDAHILAMEEGQIGEEYIIGGEPRTIKEAVSVLRDVSGSNAKVHWLSPLLLIVFSYISAVLGKIIELPEEFTAEGLRVMAGRTYLGSNQKAKNGLKYEPRSIEQGFEDMLQNSRL